MEQHHRDLIRKKYTDLCNIIGPSVDGICDYLFEKGLISKPMKQDVLAKFTEMNQGSALLDLIVRRGPYAFDALYQAILREDLLNAANILMPENAPHEAQDEEGSNSGLLEADSVYDKTVDDDWPQSEFLEDINVLRLKSPDVCPKNRKIYHSHKNNTAFHQMTKKKRGKPFILFDGSQPLVMDRKGVQNLLSYLNFDSLKSISVKNKQALEDIEFVPEGKCQCLVIFVISSGHFLSSTKALETKLEKETKLAGIPKLVFHVTKNTETIQSASDGASQKWDDGPDKPSCSPKRNPISNIKPKSFSQLEQNQEEKAINNFDDQDGVDGFINENMISKKSDVVIVKSTEYGAEELEKNEKKFTRFIQLIVYLFSIYAHNEKFNDLLRKLNSNSTGQDVATSTGRLTKELYFFPNLFDEDSS